MEIRGLWENDMAIYKYQVAAPAERSVLTEQHKLYYLLERNRTGVQLQYKYPKETLLSLKNTNAQNPEVLTFKESKLIQTDYSGHLNQSMITK